MFIIKMLVRSQSDSNFFVEKQMITDINHSISSFDKKPNLRRNFFKTKTVKINDNDEFKKKLIRTRTFSLTGAKEIHDDHDCDRKILSIVEKIMLIKKNLLKKLICTYVDEQAKMVIYS